MTTNDPRTRTECPGCFDEFCAICEPWHSMPSKTHGRRISATPKRSASQPARQGGVELEDGIYKDGDRIVKVYHTVHGSNQQVGKVWNADTRSFEYGGKRAMRGLTPAHRMTLAEAKEFGAIYGICCNCSATLTDERSIEEGIGPVCAKRFA
jgi:hypothetical protein